MVVEGDNHSRNQVEAGHIRQEFPEQGTLQEVAHIVVVVVVMVHIAEVDIVAVADIAVAGIAVAGLHTVAA